MSSLLWKIRFWCKDKTKENIALIFLAELYFMLLGVTIHAHQFKNSELT